MNATHCGSEPIATRDYSSMGSLRHAPIKSIHNRNVAITFANVIITTQLLWLLFCNLTKM